MSDIITGIKEIWYINRGRKWMCSKNYLKAVDYFERVSHSSLYYRVVIGMLAFSYVNLGEEKKARDYMCHLKNESEGNEGYLAYIDHLDAALTGNMSLLKESNDRFNRAVNDRYVKMSLLLFRQKPAYNEDTFDGLRPRRDTRI